MSIIEKYIEYKNNKNEIECVFNINRLGSIMFLDGNVKVILDEKMKAREAEEYIDQGIKVNVSRIDTESNTVYVSRIKTLNERIGDAIENGEKYVCTGTVIRVNRNNAYVDIENSGIIGVINANAWRRNAYIRSLTEKCTIGDVIEVCVVEKNNKQDDMEATWRLSREDITTDPWDALMEDVWIEDATINVECVEIPKGKTYWWGKCSQIEDIELVSDFSNRFEIRINGKYRCKIREVNKNKCIFRIAPFAEIEVQDDNIEDIREYEQLESENVSDTKLPSFSGKIDNADSIVVNILDAVNSSEDLKKAVLDIFENNSFTMEQQIFCLNKAIIVLLGNNDPEKAYELLKGFRGSFSINPKMYIGLIVQAASLFKKKGSREYVDNTYGEFLLFLKMNIATVDPKVFVGTMNSAINFYVEEHRYADVIKILNIYMSKIPANSDSYNFENSRLYYYRGMMKKTRGDYASAKSEFYFCLKYANKRKKKDDYNRFIGMSVAEMKKCDALIEEVKNRPKTDEDIIDEYYQNLQYDEAYKYALKLYTDNQDNSEIIELYERAKQIYEKSQIRMASLPLETKKGKYYRYAFAAESIEDNLERAEELWNKSIEEKEPGRLYAITAYINVLCKMGKYYDALEAHEKYQSYFADIIEIYSFKIKVIDIYKKLGAYEEAVEEGLKIAKKYAGNPKFINAGGEKRLASLYQAIAAIQTKELGLYESANRILDKARKCGIDGRIYASAYINNCMLLGQSDKANEILIAYENDLSDEYILSIKRSLSIKNDLSNDSNATFREQNLLQNNENFFDWYLQSQFEDCTEDVKTFFDMEEFKSVDEIRKYIGDYDNYETNLKAQLFLNILSAKYVIDTLDGYASRDYYSFIASALKNDNEIRNRTNHRNIVLLKYQLIALYESREEGLLRVTVEAILKDISLEKDLSNLRKYIAVLFNNNPILKSLNNWLSDKATHQLCEMTDTASVNEAKSFIEEMLNEYTEYQNGLIENKNLIHNYMEADLKETDTVLVDIFGNTAALLQEDRNFVNKLIEINRTLIGISKQKDYLSIDAILDKATEMVKNTRILMADAVTPLCLTMWFEILDEYENIILDEKNKIEVTLSPRVSISIDNTSLYASNGRVTVTYLIRNAENCAPAKDIHVSFEDSEGNLLVSKDVNIDKLFGGESNSLSQDFNTDKTFSLVIRISYKDNVGVIKKLECSESILVNQEKAFVDIHNPFTTAKFDPNDPQRIFVGRDELIKNLRLQILDESIRCAVLYGQKRTGKSSIFNKLSSELSTDFVSAYILMSNVSSMDTFYKAVAAAFKRGEADKEIRSRIEILIVPKDNFEFEDYLTSIKGIYDGKRVLLLLDEFSHLYDLRNTEFPEQFMNSWKEMMEYDLFSAVITGQETLNDLIKIFPNQFAVQYTVPVDYIPYKYFKDLIDIPLRDANGCSRFEENSFEIFWQLTKGQPYLSQILGGKLVEYLNSSKMERIYDATINKVVEEYIRTATEKDFDSFYCKYSKNAGEYMEEVSATLQLLIKIAEECSYNGNYSCDISRISMSREEDAIKADLVRRGVIVIDDNRCEIYVRLFYEWLRNKGKNIFSMQETYVDVVSEQQIQKQKNENTTPIVNNNYYTVEGNVNQISGDVNQVEGDLIHSQVNNVTVSIENAVMGLEKLQQMVDNPLIAVGDVQKQIESVKFDPKLWESLDEEEQEEKSSEYADRIFNSAAFVNKELTQEQKSRFGLTSDVLGMLSADCKKQIICGIQVYDLIQYCIDNFGLEMEGLESPRAILFARAFEKHMKDCMYKAFGKIEGFASQTLRSGKRIVSLSEYPIDRTTIGNYTTMLEYNRSYKILKKYACEQLGYVDKNEAWWVKTIAKLKEIGLLRNECCHSGSVFGSKDLSNLVRLIFKEQSIEAVYVVKEIYDFTVTGNRIKKTEPTNNSISVNQSTNGKKTTSSNNTKPELVDSMIGKKCSFTMKEKTGRKGIRGLVNDKYLASMSPNEAKKTVYALGKKIQVIIDSIQDGRYVVKLP